MCDNEREGEGLADLLSHSFPPTIRAALSNIINNAERHKRLELWERTLWEGAVDGGSGELFAQLRMAILVRGELREHAVAIAAARAAVVERGALCARRRLRREFRVLAA